MPSGSNFIDITGKKFGRLSVVRLSEKKDRKGHNAYWDCVCECGKAKVVMGVNLRKGTSKSCGCFNSERTRLSEPGQCGFNILFKGYIHDAAKRNLIFDIPEDHFRALTKENCHYCGVEPRQTIQTTSVKVTESTVEHGKYTYNGIDRKNNNLGYVEGNCVPCCLICNRAKSSLEYDAFVEYINRIKADR